MPCRMKEGHIFEYKNYYYCIGGTCKTDPNNEESPDEGSEILRYSFDDKRWEVILHSNEKNPSANSLKDLISSGVFYYDNKVYLVGGKIKINDTYNISNQVYSINLRNDKFTIVKEEFELPIRLLNPCCINTDSSAIIFGGYLEDGLANKEIFKIDLLTGFVETLNIKIESESIKFYPPYYEEGQVIFFAENSLWTLKCNEGIFEEHKFEEILQNFPRALDINKSKSYHDHTILYANLKLKSNQNLNLLKKMKKLEKNIKNIKSNNKKLELEKAQEIRSLQEIDENLLKSRINNREEMIVLIEQMNNTNQQLEKKSNQRLEQLDNLKNSKILEKINFENEIQKKVDEINGLRIEKNQKIHELESKIIILKNEIENLKNQHNEENKIREKQRNMETFESHLLKFERERDLFISKKTEEIDEASSKLKKKNKEINKIDKEMSKLINEKNIQNQELDEMKSNLNNILIHSHDNCDYERLKQNFEDLEKKLKIECNLHNQLKSEKEKLIQNTCRLENFIKKLKERNKLESRNDEIIKLQEDQSEIKKDINDLKISLELKNKYLRNLKNENIELNESNKRKKKQYTKDIKSLKQTIESSIYNSEDKQKNNSEIMKDEENDMIKTSIYNSEDKQKNNSEIISQMKDQKNDLIKKLKEKIDNKTKINQDKDTCINEMEDKINKLKSKSHKKN